MWLRDVLDFLCHQKLRELTDFEWQQFLRLYIQEDPSKTFVVHKLVAIWTRVMVFAMYVLCILSWYVVMFFESMYVGIQYVFL